MKGLHASTVLPERHVSTHTYTLQIDSAPDLKRPFILRIGSDETKSRRIVIQRIETALISCYVLALYLEYQHC